MTMDDLQQYRHLKPIHVRRSRSWLTRGLLLLLGASLLVSCGQKNATSHQDLLRVKSTQPASAAHKKVILIVADSLLSQAIDRGIEQNKLPTIKALIERGRYERKMISSFPTMSVTIDSSLLTGSYPDVHRIPGLIWYSEKEQRLINYGTGPSESLHQGMRTVIHDGLISLNRDHLSPNVSTIFEELHKQGKTSGSINGLIYRGPFQHELAFPEWVQQALSFPEKQSVMGPDLFAFGTFSNPLEGKIELPVGPTKRFGLNNDYGIHMATYLAEKKQFPDFLYLYLPDADQKLHKHGPSEEESTVKLDHQLHTLLQGFGSIDEALKQCAIIIIGDSGVSQVQSRQNGSKIELMNLLKDYAHLQPGKSPEALTDLAIGANEAMAYVYRFKHGPALSALASLLAKDSRIDQLAWMEGDEVHVLQAGTGHLLQYRAGGDWTDPYRQTWSLTGDLDVMDIQADQDSRTIRFNTYPDGLKRLHAALNSHEGEYLVVTAKSGYELADENSPVHPNGGAHGSLHINESLVPIIAAGTADWPDTLRIVDLKPWLVKLVTLKEQPAIPPSR
ncbi:alkaline phosphatase family protein [Paenibacillus sp. 1001270B_150601_E10]|uniref:alkaline phosphatase family protein n=1 Tax=Paenibacillus sp. 1001270B_150601_E10 TaxID=2787079 RepID=UPI001E291F12|nr:alkaline phosphatase family protein [Paenibacillus sp. 1001270B_150601_E10]